MEREDGNFAKGMVYGVLFSALLWVLLIASATVLFK
jgi:hypothetical protein